MATLSLLASIQSVERFIRSEVAVELATRESSAAEQLPNVLQLVRAADNVQQDDVTTVLEHLAVEGDTFSKAQRVEKCASCEDCVLVQ